MSNFEVNFDGFYNGEPYVIDTYRDTMYIEIDKDNIRNAREIKDPIEKLVYMFLDSCSNSIMDESGFLVFFKIGVEQIADCLGFSYSEVFEAMKSLGLEGKLKVIKVDEGVNAYATA